MIEVSDIIRLKVVAMRKERDLPSHFKIQDLEDRIDDIKLRIYKMKLDIGYDISTTPEVNPKTQNPPGRGRVVGLGHSEEPSSNLFASLSANPSFRNAVRT